MKKIRVKLTFVQEVLGTACNNPAVYDEYIAKKSGSVEKAAEEMETLPAGELEEKGMTVFHRDGDVPILYDYMIAGFIKEALGAAVEYGAIKFGTNQKVSKYTYKRVVDNQIFVTPRKLHLVLPEGGAIGECVRPLRCETMRGDRVALAKSETVPEGTTVEFFVMVMHDALVPLVTDAFVRGAMKGIGQWRNAGNGRFVFEMVEVLPSSSFD